MCHVLSLHIVLPLSLFVPLHILCVGAEHQVVGPAQPIVGMVGNDVILPCRLEPTRNAAEMTVEWTRPGLDPRFVYVWRDGVELESKKHPSYKGRTSVSAERLKLGDISLKLSAVKISDEGRYRCFIPDLGESFVQLAVGAASSPAIKNIDKSSSGLVLQCDSAGWYPEPEVFWLDGEGNLLSAGPPETVRGPDDLYTVSSRVTVEKRHSNSFTCRVTQKETNQTRETQIQVPDHTSAVQRRSDTVSGLAVTLAFSLLFNVCLLFFCCRRWLKKRDWV